ncbi:hypothetical protein HPB51_016645 [Rhipicephalus microplus]|uniref:Uncharacterized protein n=1 Tax=Rhipicephalus microplus TaxID=6941 RepID=A0A9J6EHG1_RHIMP|nr:hypothetical protein HPB51_016645 [Rhipicephalus microplus]
MKNTKPFDERKTILCYNAAMMLVTIATSVGYYVHRRWMCALSSSGSAMSLSLFLKGPDLSTRPTTMILLQVSGWHLVMRLSECIKCIVLQLHAWTSCDLPWLSLQQQSAPCPSQPMADRLL